MNNNLYHNIKYPYDKNGKKIKPLDLVILRDIPDHYWVEEDSASLRLFTNCYGLVTYHPSFDNHLPDPYYLKNKEHPGWVSGDGSVIYVETRRIDHDTEQVFSWGLWLPSKMVQFIPYNSLIMNIFVEYPWQMNDVDGPSDYLFIRSGIPEYEYLKKIMETPYEELVKAHDAAMAVLENK